MMGNLAAGGGEIDQTKTPPRRLPELPRGPPAWGAGGHSGRKPSHAEQGLHAALQAGLLVSPHVHSEPPSQPSPKPLPHLSVHNVTSPDKPEPGLSRVEERCHVAS